jgi:hypothetical protein
VLRSPSIRCSDSVDIDDTPSKKIADDVHFSDPLTYKTFDGVEAGDIGAKCGWNGLDNGYVSHE